MKEQKIDYPVEFVGRFDKKYKLIKEYDHYALYETNHYRVCFDMENIKSEKRWVDEHSRRVNKIQLLFSED